MVPKFAARSSIEGLLARLDLENQEMAHDTTKDASVSYDAVEHGATDESEIWWGGILGRRKRLVLPALQIVGTWFVVSLAVLLAYLMLYGWPGSLQYSRRTALNFLPSLVNVIFTAEFRPYIQFFLLSPVIHVLVFQWLRLYQPQHGDIVPFSTTTTVIKGAAAGSLMLLLLSFAYASAQTGQTLRYPMLFFAYHSSLVLFGVLLFQPGTLIAVLFLHLLGIGRTRIAVIGSPSGSKALIEAFQSPSSAYALAGLITPEDKPVGESGDVACLGEIHDLAQIVNKHDLEEVLMAVDPATLSMEQRVEVAQTCWRLGVELKMVAPFYPVFRTSARAEHVGGLTLLHVEKVGLYARWPQIVKRGMDIAISLLTLIATSPILLITMLLIKLDSPGPIFFVQTRVGLNGRTFRILKLRSMRQDADKNAQAHQEYLTKLIKDGKASQVDKDGKPIYKIVSDPRITRLGKFIRKTSIDELPQLFNALRGKMSLVGPRPPIPYEVEQYKDWHLKRLNIRPGITGLWQVSGRSNLTFDEMIKLDIDYIENWSLWLDIKILLKTVFVVLNIGQSH